MRKYIAENVFGRDNIMLYSRKVVHGIYNGYHVLMMKDENIGTVLHIYGTNNLGIEVSEDLIDKFTDYLLTLKNFEECAYINHRILMLRIDTSIFKKKRILQLKSFLEEVTNFFIQNDFVSTCMDCDVSGRHLGMAYIKGEECRYQVLCPLCYKKRIVKFEDSKVGTKEEKRIPRKAVFLTIFGVLFTSIIYNVLVYLGEYGQPALLLLFVIPYLNFRIHDGIYAKKRLGMVFLFLIIGFLIVEYFGFITRYLIYDNSITTAYAMKHLFEFIGSIELNIRMLIFDGMFFVIDIIVLGLLNKRIVNNDFNRMKFKYFGK